MWLALPVAALSRVGFARAEAARVGDVSPRGGDHTVCD